ncbi:MAG: hypothetical protein C0596_13290 [Marinilabiliales bacterium]|nr:MAG: hypothetical protein C0596_13290 [Marinilabiliales bacterium]
MKRLTLFFTALITFGVMMAQDVHESWTVATADITVTEETTTVNEGTSAMSVTFTSKDNQDIESYPFNVVAGASYSYTLDVYDFDAAGRVRMAIAWDTENTYSSIYSEDIDAWQTLTLEGTVPAGASTAQIRLRFYDVSGDWTGSATMIIDNASYTEDGGANLILNPSFETWGPAVLLPELTVTAPTNGTTVTVDNVDVEFSTENFVLGTDGSLEYILNGGTAAYTTTSPVNVSGLVEGANTIEMQLVDMSNLPLDPVEAVTRTVNYEIPSTDPAITINFPIDGTTVYASDVNISFTLENFVPGTDGKIAYSVDGGTTEYHTTTDDIALLALSYAEHTVEFELVDMAEVSLDPAVTTSVTFTCAEALPGGMETFELSDIGGTYSDGSFVGDNDITWNYFHSRDTGAYPINLKGLMLRRGADSYLLSQTISGGIASFQCSMRKAFTGSSTRQLELYVNDVLVGTSEEFGAFTGEDATTYTFYVSDIDVPGDFTIKVKPVGTATTNAQVVIDDISWTGFESTDPYLSITSPVNAEEVTSADVDIVFNVENFVLGTDGQVKYSVDGGADQYTTTSPVSLTSLTDGSHTVTMELVDMSNLSLDPAVTDDVTFTVNTAAPTYTTVYDIQYTEDPSGNSPSIDLEETTRGIVSGINGDKFWLQDGAGAWNGVYVYYTTTPGPARGDSVWVTGTVVEYNNLTEISTITDMTVINSGNTVAAAAELATGSVGVEEYEGVLVTVTGVCTNADAGYGMFELNDCSGTILVDDVMYAATVVAGNSYTVTGLVDYSFEEWKILPRDAADVIDNGASTTPLLTISSPANSATVYTANVDVEFSVSNFVLGTDGQVAWDVDGGATAYVTASPINVIGLTDGSHTVNLELVDMSNNTLATPVTATVTFTVDLSGPVYTSISDIQNEIATGDVWVRAVVSANFNGSDYGEGYYIQQGGGAWNGIYVYDLVNTPAIGDSVEIAATIDEYYDMTQLADITSYTVVGIEGTVAAPTVVSTLDAATEQYESVLVKVSNAECTEVQNGYGEWYVNDGSGALMAKDNGVFDFTEALGTSYDIIGVMAYSYGEFSINYRIESDITISSDIESELVQNVSVYPNPSSDFVNIVTDGADFITITNIVGQIVKEVSV